MSWRFPVRKALLWPVILGGLVWLNTGRNSDPSAPVLPPSLTEVRLAFPRPSTEAPPEASTSPQPGLSAKSEAPAALRTWVAPPELQGFLKSRDRSYLTPDARQKLTHCSAECVHFLSTAAELNAHDSEMSMALMIWLASGQSSGAFVGLAAVSGQLEQLARLPSEHQERLDTLTRELATSHISLEQQDWIELAKLERIGDVVGLDLGRRLAADIQSQATVLKLIGAATSSDDARGLLRLGNMDLWFDALGDTSIRNNQQALRATVELVANYNQSDWLARFQNLSASSEPGFVDTVVRAWAPAQLSGDRLRALDDWLARNEMDAASLRLADLLLQFAEDQQEAGVIRSKRGIAALRH